MNKYDVGRLIERGKLVFGILVTGGAAIFCVVSLYGAWAYGTIRARRTGIVSVVENADAFWFSVAVHVLFLVLVLAGAAFWVWAGRLRMPPEPRHRPIIDDSRSRPFGE